MLHCTHGRTLALLSVLAFSPAATAAEKAAASSPQRSSGGSELVRLEAEQSRIADELISVEALLGAIEKKIHGSRLQVGLDSETSERYSVRYIGLYLDGALVYERQFEKSSAFLKLSIYDGYLEPGPHTLRLEARVAGPDSAGEPAYYAASGLVVQLRQNTICRASFQLELEGDASADTAREQKPDAEWSVDIDAGYEVVEAE